MAKKKKEPETKPYFGARPADAPSFESQTVAGVLKGANLKEAPEAPLATELEDVPVEGFGDTT